MYYYVSHSVVGRSVRNKNHYEVYKPERSSKAAEKTEGYTRAMYSKISVTGTRNYKKIFN